MFLFWDQPNSISQKIPLQKLFFRIWSTQTFMMGTKNYLKKLKEPEKKYKGFTFSPSSYFQHVSLFSPNKTKKCGQCSFPPHRLQTDT